jgi:hypothetical protein
MNNSWFTGTLNYKIVLDRDLKPKRLRNTAIKDNLFKGKLGIDLERKMVIHDEKDPNVWKAPSVDKNELQEAKKYAAPERKVR